MPAAIKQLMLDEVKRAVGDSTTLLILDTSKLKSDESLNLRSGLRKLGSKLKVGKSSVLVRAIPEGAKPAMPKGGPVGVIAIGGDIAATAKLIIELAKEEKVKLHGGFLDGKALDAKQAAKLSELPTREQANVMLIRLLQSPYVQVLRVLKAKSEEGAEKPAAG